MGNRAKHPQRGRPKKQLVKTINLGDVDSYPRYVYEYLKQQGHIKEDQFSNWVRDCIKLRYKSRDCDEIVAHHLFGKMLRNYDSQRKLASENNDYAQRIKDLGFDPDLTNRHLKRINNQD